MLLPFECVIVQTYHPGPGCSKLGYDNLGLVWNLILDLEALKENSIPFLLATVWWLDVLKGTEEIIWKRLSNKGKKKSRLKYNTSLALIRFKQPGTALSIGGYPIKSQKPKPLQRSEGMCLQEIFKT